MENDTGPDDGVHAWDGLFVLADPRGRGGCRGPSPPAAPGGTEGPRQQIMDVAPTLLRLLGETPPGYMLGRAISSWVP